MSAWLAAIALAPAAALAAGARPVVVGGYDAGGDAISTITYVSGKTESIGANEGLYLGGGVSVLNDARNVELVATLSIKYQNLHADNGDVWWTRFPLDALVFYRWPSLRLGGGLTYAIHPRLEGSGAASDIDTKLDNALGAVVQGDYLLDGFALGLRATLLDYKFGGSTVKANGLGVSFGFTF